MDAQQLVEFQEIIHAKKNPSHKPDKHTRKLLRYLFTSTRGGYTRLRIIVLLLQNQYNTHQLSKELGLDYKAIQHHIKVLERNNLVTKLGDRYGAIYRLSNLLELNISVLEEAIEELRRQIDHKKVYL